MSPSLLSLVSLGVGIFFFAWPVRMSQSGLPAAGAMFAYASISIVTALGALSLSPGAWEALRGRGLWVGLQAGVLNVLGVLLFTFVLSRATAADVPRQILVVIVTQTALAGAWAAYQAGAVEPRLVAGLATAAATVYLLR